MARAGGKRISGLGRHVILSKQKYGAAMCHEKVDCGEPAALLTNRSVRQQWSMRAWQEVVMYHA